jgi:4-amino-4-deoxy-L-arabinose transferase-like glycosyltransferase
MKTESKSVYSSHLFSEPELERVPLESPTPPFESPQQRYRRIDTFLQGLVLWPTLFLILFPPAFALGLLLLGFVQLTSALCGAIYWSDKTRWVYLGSSLAFICFWSGIFTLGWGRFDLPGYLDPVALTLIYLPAVIGAFWYYHYSKKSNPAESEQEEWV